MDCLKWSWGFLDRLKMLPLSPLRFSTIGKPILRTFEILKIFRFFDNSSRTRAKARAKATARAMARATARARRTRARAKDRARARDGRMAARPDGAIALAKCATPQNAFARCKPKYPHPLTP